MEYLKTILGGGIRVEQGPLGRVYSIYIDEELHWNVEGDNFMEMHKFYETQYGELGEIIDDVAERVRSLDHYSEGRLKDFLAFTQLDEPSYTNKQNEHLRNLLYDHEAIIRNLRKLITLLLSNTRITVLAIL